MDSSASMRTWRADTAAADDDDIVEDIVDVAAASLHHADSSSCSNTSHVAAAAAVATAWVVWSHASMRFMQGTYACVSAIVSMGNCRQHPYSDQLLRLTCMGCAKGCRNELSPGAPME